MGVNITCPNGHELNVESPPTGPRETCPQCGETFDVPVQATLADSTAAEDEAVWFVMTSRGGQFGPAAARHMRQWIAEGRVDAGSLVWRDGWTEWRAASDVFPELAATDPPPVAAGTSSIEIVTHPATTGPNLNARFLNAPILNDPIFDDPITTDPAETDALDVRIRTGPSPKRRRAAALGIGPPSHPGPVIYLSIVAVVLLAILFYVMLRQ